MGVLLSEFIEFVVDGCNGEVDLEHNTRQTAKSLTVKPTALARTSRSRRRPTCKAWNEGNEM